MKFNTYFHFPFIFSVLQHHAQLAYRLLADVAGLRPIMPAGAMYMMVKLLSLSQLFGLLMGPSNVIKVGMDMTKFPGFESDLQFVEQMVTEQSVFCLPGRVRIPNGFIATLFISLVLLFLPQCFDYPNYFRIVLTVPEVQLREACSRIAQYSAAHYVKAQLNGQANGHAIPEEEHALCTKDQLKGLPSLVYGTSEAEPWSLKHRRCQLKFPEWSPFHFVSIFVYQVFCWFFS